jgi:uncharacterized protein YecE (DUF72 family)
MQWWIGCSGYHYPEWKGVFYPEKLPQRKWLAYYNEHFDTLELNVTFYRFPRLEFLLGWYSQSPNHYSFSLKVPRLITHSNKRFESRESLARFYERAREGLRKKLGCVLFQFPPWLSYSEEALESLNRLLDHSFPNVLEFRHESWWRDDVFSILSQHNVTFCGQSHPTLPDDMIKTSDIIYYRFHGVPDLYSSRYKKQKLHRVAEQIMALKNIQQAYIYFNNTAAGHAITNAKEFIAIVKDN